MKSSNTIAAALFAAGIMSAIPAIAADTNTTTTTTNVTRGSPEANRNDPASPTRATGTERAQK